MPKTLQTVSNKTTQGVTSTKHPFVKPRSDCGNCHGYGLQFFADSFDHDNGTVCPSCERYAKKCGKKLLLPVVR